MIIFDINCTFMEILAIESVMVVTVNIAFHTCVLIHVYTICVELPGHKRPNIIILFYYINYAIIL